MVNLTLNTQNSASSFGIRLPKYDRSVDKETAFDLKNVVTYKETTAGFYE